MTTPDTYDELASDRAFADWVEAEALVAGLRRSAAAAAERASDRARAAASLARAGRRDAYALGVADAADVLARRAEVERHRLEAALREENRLRALAFLARGANRSPSEPAVRFRCG